MKSHAQNLSLSLPFETNIQQGQKLCKYHFYVMNHKEMKIGHSCHSIHLLFIFKKVKATFVCYESRPRK